MADPSCSDRPSVAQRLAQAVTEQEEFGVVVLDSDMRVTQCSVAPQCFRGLEVAVGQEFCPLLEPHGASDDPAGRVAQVLSDGIPQVLHAQPIRDPAGLVVDLSVFRQEEEGGPPGLLLVFVDVTDAVRTRQSLDLLLDATSAIGTSLDVARTARQLAQALLGLGDVVTVNLAHEVLTGRDPPQRDRGGDVGLRRAAVAATERTPLPDGFLKPGDDLPALPDKASIRRHQHGEALWLPTLADVTEALDNEPALVRALIPGPDVHALIHSPLLARNLILGSVEVWRTAGSPRFAAEDVRLLATITARAALAVDNARRYARERGATEELQRSMLPAPYTETHAVQAAGIYLPTDADGQGAGGDWYDVIPLPSLRVALAVGDVVGHGLRATATMGRMRSAIQVLAQLELPPEELLAHLDDFVAKLAADDEPAHEDALSSTCLYAVYDPIGHRLSAASAGHPPPVLMRPDGVVRYMGLNPGPPLGIGGLPFESSVVDVPTDSVLVLYSDGLVQHRNQDIGHGMEDLLARLAQVAPIAPTPSGLQKAADRIVADIAPGELADDVTVLVSGLRAVPDTDIAAWPVPDEAAAVAESRRHTADQLDAWGVAEAAGFVVELVVSELVTNAIRYAGAPVLLRLVRTNTSLVCEVSDPSNTQPRLRRARTTDEGGRGLFLVAQLCDSWGARYDGPTGKTIWAEKSLADEGDPLAALPGLGI
ncbi:SpoIIE family protein phosphatase [Streptomyces sp. NPDC049040]|uniref:SpoIIE family protein phosphatase n=1 Tax=Streptomyces sp. NPDC049040 TaxID=3365593 RepID=UPI0037187F81